MLVFGKEDWIKKEIFRLFPDNIAIRWKLIAVEVLHRGSIGCEKWNDCRVFVCVNSLYAWRRLTVHRLHASLLSLFDRRRLCESLFVRLLLLLLPRWPPILGSVAILGLAVCCTKVPCSTPLCQNTFNYCPCCSSIRLFVILRQRSFSKYRLSSSEP